MLTIDFSPVIRYSKRVVQMNDDVKKETYEGRAVARDRRKGRTV